MRPKAPGGSIGDERQVFARLPGVLEPPPPRGRLERRLGMAVVVAARTSPENGLIYLENISDLPVDGNRRLLQES
jgi:hypothetical protein